MNLTKEQQEIYDGKQGATLIPCSKFLYINEVQ